MPAGDLSVTTEAASRHPLAGQGRVLVGRARELEELESALGAAISGRGRIRLLAGEPGIGKTRLADELADRAASRGVRVLWGRCREGSRTPPYRPWIQVLRSLVAAGEPAILRSQLGAGAPYLRQLIPEIRRLEEPGLPAPSFPREPERARFYLFASVTTFLRRVSVGEPLLLVLDDLHAADLSSLRLLQFLARELRDCRILVVATYRSVEANLRAELGEILADIARQEPRARRDEATMNEANFLAARGPMA